MSEILIYSDIGPEWAGMVSAKTFVDQINDIGRGNPVTVRINSPGGDIIDAQTMYNAMRRHSEGGGKVTVEIDGLAASAASYVAMAGDRIRMAENAIMMIHNAWTFAIGNAEQIRQTANVLDKFDGVISATYAARAADRTLQEIVAMMADETWMNAQEAVEFGFADEIGQRLNVVASVHPDRYKRTPERLLASKEASGQDGTLNAAERLNLIRQKIRLTRAR